MKKIEGTVLIYHTELPLSQGVSKIQTEDFEKYCKTDIVMVINPVTLTTTIIKNRWGVKGRVLK